MFAVEIYIQFDVAQRKYSWLAEKRTKLEGLSLFEYQLQFSNSFYKLPTMGQLPWLVGTTDTAGKNYIRKWMLIPVVYCIPYW